FEPGITHATFICYAVIIPVIWFTVHHCFFSSRRGHPRLVSDWSSDVCSSDLRRRRKRRQGGHAGGIERRPGVALRPWPAAKELERRSADAPLTRSHAAARLQLCIAPVAATRGGAE